MGVDSTGILCFGLQLKPKDDLNDDDIYFWHKKDNEDFGPDEWLAEVFGNDYRNRPVDIIWHRSYSYPKFILTVRGSETKAYRGWPLAIDTSQMVHTEMTGKKTIIDFCTKYGISCNPEDIQWWLCSMYG